MLSGNSAMKDDSTWHENRDIVYDSLGKKTLNKAFVFISPQAVFHDGTPLTNSF